MVKVYSVYMASFDGTASLNATLTDPNGQYVSKADFDLIQSKLDKAVAVIMAIENDVAYFEHAAKRYLEVGAEKQSIIKVGTPVRAMRERIDEFNLSEIGKG